jgi:hypothetical protein
MTIPSELTESSQDSTGNVGVDVPSTASINLAAQDVVKRDEEKQSEK